MPSSHATTAAAFASAATLGAPKTGLVLVPVAASRVYGRQHHLADIAAGTALGVAAGTLVHVLSGRLRTRPGDDPARAPEPALSG